MEKETKQKAPEMRQAPAYWRSKKVFVAGYAGLMLFVLLFVSSALLQLAGRKHQSRIAIFAAIIIFGLNLLLGIYSNWKNYGWVWTGWMSGRRWLSIAELDPLARRRYKGSWQYGLAMVFVLIMAIATCTIGVVLLRKEMLSHQALETSSRKEHPHPAH